MDYVLYHADCMDGLGAAWALHRSPEWRDATFIACAHGKPVPAMPGLENLAIVDFSFDRATVLRLAHEAESLVLLDHHKTAFEELGDLSASDDLPTGTSIVLCREKSGAVMAWEYATPLEPVPEILLYVQDRDLWRWGLINSKAVNAYLRTFLDPSFAAWYRIVAAWDHLFPKIVREGEILVAHTDELVARACRHRFAITIAGHQATAVCASAHQSEIGHLLCTLEPAAAFAAVYSLDGFGDLRVSLRSVGDFDVSAVARLFGGGGHRNAAGFAASTVSPELALACAIQDLNDKEEAA